MEVLVVIGVALVGVLSIIALVYLVLVAMNMADMSEVALWCWRYSSASSSSPLLYGRSCPQVTSRSRRGSHTRRPSSPNQDPAHWWGCLEEVFSETR